MDALERARSIVKAAAEANHAARRLRIDAEVLANARRSFAGALRDDEHVLVATQSVLLTEQHLYANRLRMPMPLHMIVLVTDEHPGDAEMVQDAKAIPRQLLKINGLVVAEERYIPFAFLKAALEQLGEETRRAMPARAFGEDELSWIAAAGARSGESIERTSARLRAIGAGELAVRVLVQFMHDRAHRRRFGEALPAVLQGLAAWAIAAVVTYGFMILYGFMSPGGGILVSVGIAATGLISGFLNIVRGVRLALGRQDLPEDRLVAEWVASRRAAAAGKL